MIGFTANQGLNIIFLGGQFSPTDIYIAHPMCRNCAGCGRKKMRRTQFLPSGCLQVSGFQHFQFAIDNFLTQISMHYCQDMRSSLYTTGHHLPHKCTLNQSSTLSFRLVYLMLAGHLHWVSKPGTELAILTHISHLSYPAVTLNSISTFQSFRQTAVDSSACSFFKTSA